MLFPRPFHHAASTVALVLVTSAGASAQYAHLTLQSQPGDLIAEGQNADIIYTPANTNNYFIASANPDFKTLPNGPITAEFDFAQFGQDPDNYATLSFSTEQLGVPLTVGTYTGAQRYPFEAAGHPGLDVTFQHAGNNTLTGNFTITAFTYTVTAPNTFVIDAFDATFEQHSEGLPPALFGQFSYRSAGTPPPAVPEASTTVSFGLLLALGLGGAVVASRRKKAAA